MALPPPYRRHSNIDFRTIRTEAAFRASPSPPIHHACNHSQPTLPRPITRSRPTSKFSDYPHDNSRFIPYADAATLEKLLSQDHHRPLPRRPQVLSDLTSDRLLPPLPLDVASNHRLRVRRLPAPRHHSSHFQNGQCYHQQHPLSPPHHPQSQHLRMRPSPLPPRSTKPSSISWHRSHPSSRSPQASTPTTATSSGGATPPLRITTTPISRSRIATRQKERKLMRHRPYRAASAIGNEQCYQTPSLSLVDEDPARLSLHDQRGSLRNAPAYVTRKLSALRWIPDQLRDVPSDSVFEHQPIHPIISLAPFGHHPSFDVVFLYTNSLRAEFNDLIFLTGCLQHSLDDPLKKKKRHKDLETDFRVWYQWFAQFTVQILRGFEDFFIPLVTELLEECDRMISQSAALLGAKGLSYPQAWSVKMDDLSQKMEQIRDSLSVIHGLLFRLQQNPGDAEGAARASLWYATFDEIGKLIPVTVDVLSELDNSIGAIVTLKLDCKRRLRNVFQGFAVLMINEGSPTLGWSAVTGLTRWIDDRKLRSQHVSSLARAGRRSLFSRFRSSHAHGKIVRTHRIRVHDEQKRRG